MFRIPKECSHSTFDFYVYTRHGHKLTFCHLIKYITPDTSKESLLGNNSNDLGHPLDLLTG